MTFIPLNVKAKMPNKAVSDASLAQLYFRGLTHKATKVCDVYIEDSLTIPHRGGSGLGTVDLAKL
jgi:hypothetical protein